MVLFFFFIDDVFLVLGRRDPSSQILPWKTRRKLVTWYLMFSFFCIVCMFYMVLPVITALSRQKIPGWSDHIHLKILFFIPEGKQQSCVQPFLPHH